MYILCLLYVLYYFCFICLALLPVLYICCMCYNSLFVYIAVFGELTPVHVRSVDSDDVV